MIKELVKMANHLDNLGHRDLADSIDGIISKFSEADGGSAPRLSLNADPETGEVSVSDAPTDAPADGDTDGDDTDGGDAGWTAEVTSFDAAQAQSLDAPASVQASVNNLIEKRASHVADLSKLFIDESSFYSR